MEAEQATELKNLSMQALQDLLNNLASAKQFALEQAPDVCQQMVMWAIMQPIIPAALFILAAPVALYSAREVVLITREHGERYANNEEGPWFVAAMTAGACSITSLLFTISLSVNALKAYIAPKVFLIQSIHDLIK